MSIHNVPMIYNFMNGCLDGRITIFMFQFGGLCRRGISIFRSVFIPKLCVRQGGLSNPESPHTPKTIILDAIENRMTKLQTSRKTDEKNEKCIVHL